MTLLESVLHYDPCERGAPGGAGGGIGPDADLADWGLGGGEDVAALLAALDDAAEEALCEADTLAAPVHAPAPDCDGGGPQAL